MPLKISQMPAVSSLDGSETFPLVKGGQNFRGALQLVTPYLNIRWFGAAVNGTTDDSAAFRAMVAAAVSTRRPMLIDGDILINTAVSNIFSGDLQLYGAGNTRLLIGSGVSGPVAIDFQATTVLTTTLAVDAVLGAWSIQLTSAAGVTPGQLIRLSTATPVDASFGYTKQAVFKVADVTGTTVFLSDPLNFGFTVAETTVTIRASASLLLNGIGVKQQPGVDKRFDLTGLQDCVMENVYIEGLSAYNGDPFLISGCYGVTARDTTIVNGRYPINVTNGSRRLLFDGVYGTSNRHPVDCNTWAYGVTIRRLVGVDTEASLQCHPSFEIHFEDCTDLSVSSPAGGIGLRCIGGSVKRCRTSNITGNAISDAQGPNLLAAYQSLAQAYKRVYEDIESNTAILSAGDVGKLEIRRCKVPNISVDGVSSRIGSISIDSETTFTASRMTLARIPVVAGAGPFWLTSPPSTFASTNTLDNITGATQANPCVITAAAHGLNAGDLIRIDGVGGMTQLNERTYTVANPTANTFELAGVDSTAYDAYTAGGVVALGRLALTIDGCLSPGLGWYPEFAAKAVIRATPTTLNPATAITIPVKVVSVYGIQEQGVRHALITIRAVSSTDGTVVNAYQVYMFTGSPSQSTVGAVQAVVPAISTLTAVIANFRHHFFTQVSNEGGDPAQDASIGEYYYSFDVVVTANNVNDRIQYVDVEVKEIRATAV